MNHLNFLSDADRRSTLNSNHHSLRLSFGSKYFRHFQTRSFHRVYTVPACRHMSIRLALIFAIFPKLILGVPGIHAERRSDAAAPTVMLFNTSLPYRSGFSPTRYDPRCSIHFPVCFCLVSTVDGNPPSPLTAVPASIERTFPRSLL